MNLRLAVASRPCRCCTHPRHMHRHHDPGRRDCGECGCPAFTRRWWASWAEARELRTLTRQCRLDIAAAFDERQEAEAEAIRWERAFDEVAAERDVARASLAQLAAALNLPPYAPEDHPVVCLAVRDDGAIVKTDGTVVALPWSEAASPAYRALSAAVDRVLRGPVTDEVVNKFGYAYGDAVEDGVYPNSERERAALGATLPTLADQIRDQVAGEVKTP